VLPPRRIKMCSNRIKPLLFLELAVLILLSSPAYAHKVNLFAYAENGRIFTESFFPDGKMVEQGKVEVFDSQDKKVLEGVTDKEGKFSFPIPKRDTLKITVDAGMGHKNSFVLKKEELGE
jgi:nickel transport protein